jgi:hypothetical protein
MTHKRNIYVTLGMISGVIIGGACADSADPQDLREVISTLKLIRSYRFGTGPDASIRDIRGLSESFNPYGIAGRIVINKEWQIYQPFNPRNFIFTPEALEITATIADHGGVFPAGIESGQIWTKEMYTPERTGYSEYAIEVRMKIPAQRGAWPAAWLYTKETGLNDGSEIDNPEFFNMATQDSHDWTGFQHGPGQGAELFSIKTNRSVWHPGIDFADDYHTYGLYWTPSTVSKYVDGRLIYSQRFSWTARGPAQLGVNLAVGTSSPNLPGLKPTSVTEFPISLAISRIDIWAK